MIQCWIIIIFRKQSVSGRDKCINWKCEGKRGGGWNVSGRDKWTNEKKYYFLFKIDNVYDVSIENKRE